MSDNAQSRSLLLWSSFLLKIYEIHFSERCVLIEQEMMHKGQKSVEDKCNNVRRQKYL
jgi:hypothetical protein